jgi:hypothetical protein
LENVEVIRTRTRIEARDYIFGPIRINSFTPSWTAFRRRFPADPSHLLEYERVLLREKHVCAETIALSFDDNCIFSRTSAISSAQIGFAQRKSLFLQENSIGAKTIAMFFEKVAVALSPSQPVRFVQIGPPAKP